MKDDLWRIMAGLGAAFGVPWLLLIVLPYLRMASAEPVPYAEDAGSEVAAYPDPQIYQTGESDFGAKIYASEGCAYCHTQVVRPTYAGADMWRPGWGGREEDGLARETRPQDYAGEEYAYLGYQRIGPDLANVGSRFPDREWHHRHLYDPQAMSLETRDSVMPSFRHLYKKAPAGVSGTAGSNAIELKDGTVIVPTDKANALVDYLLSRKKDQKLPGS
jgi:cytochrome c oxidase cbb3-type subunit 2